MLPHKYPTKLTRENILLNDMSHVSYSHVSSQVFYRTNTRDASYIGDMTHIRASYIGDMTHASVRDMNHISALED